MKNKIISTLAGILLAGSVAGCTVNPNATFWPTGPPPAGSGGWGLRTFAANGEALNGKPLTPEAKQHILNGADYLDNAEQQQEIKNYQKREHNFQREMQKDEHKFQRKMRNESRNKQPDKEFYTALCEDSNQNGKIEAIDECLIKKNSFSDNETWGIFSTNRASPKGTKSSIDIYNPDNKLINHQERIKYGDTDSFGFTDNAKYFPSGIFKAYTRTNGVLDGALEFEIINDQYQEKEFYTSVWRDLNKDGNIKPDEIFEKKKFFSKNESLSVNIIDRVSPVGSSAQVDVYCPNGKLAASDKYLYNLESGNGFAMGIPNDFLECGDGKYRVTRKTNGVLDGEIEFHILSESKSYL